MPDTFTTFRQYCTTRFQWNLNDALGQQQDEASVEDPQDVIPDDEHQDIFEPDTDV